MISAFIRELFHVDPASLTEDQFVRLAQEALFLKRFNFQQQRTAIRSVVLELFSQKM